MKQHILFILILTTTFSCGAGKKTSVTFYPLKEESLNSFVNQKSMPEDPNFTLDKTIINRDYPIEIALYKDGRFFYDLPNLTKGSGTWKFVGDQIELRAKLTLFNMYIEIHAANEENSHFAIHFTDRFGPKRLKMESRNFL